ncbi:MAG: EamA family transporter [Hyphomonadaceae bacterium]|nr:EamA family transporter [Hyphomonadaceae bacterium]
MTTPRAFAPLDLLQLVSVPLVWGVNNVAAMIAVRELPPLLVAGLRFAIVFACLFWLLRPPPRGQALLFFAMLAVIGPLHFGVQYVGLGLAQDLAPMVVAMQLWAPASVACAALLLGERVGPLRWLGVAIAFVGAAGMTFDPVVFAQWGAFALVGLASVFYGLGTVLVRRLRDATDPWATQAWIALAVAPTLIGGSFAFEGDHAVRLADASWLAWACIVFGALVSSIVANAFMFSLLQKYEVSRTTPYMLMTPVVSFTLAALVLGDTITVQILIGAGMAMAGIALVALAERRGA